jgi:hypothetical protein
MYFENLSDPNPDLVLDTKEMTKPDTDGKKKLIQKPQHWMVV